MCKTTNNKLLRVTQLNAVYLDKEIHNFFMESLKEVCKNLPASFVVKYEQELQVFTKILIQYYSVVKFGSTFGQQLLSIKYDKMSYFQRFFYVVLSNLSYYSGSLKQLNLVVHCLEFINLSIFLRTGRKPTLIERVLGLEQSFLDNSSSRQFESKYLARELLWNGFIEVIVNVLPLINYFKMKRLVKKLNPFYRKTNYVSLSGNTMNVHSKCSFCGLSPPILPHHMGCQHVFCYVCLKGNQQADPRFECSTCEHRNPNILCDKVTVL